MFLTEVMLVLFMHRTCIIRLTNGTFNAMGCVKCLGKRSGMEMQGSTLLVLRGGGCQTSRGKHYVTPEWPVRSRVLFTSGALYTCAADTLYTDWWQNTHYKEMRTCLATVKMNVTWHGSYKR